LPCGGDPTPREPLYLAEPRQTQVGVVSFLPGSPQPLPFGRGPGQVQSNLVGAHRVTKGSLPCLFPGGTDVISPPKGSSSNSPLWKCLQKRNGSRLSFLLMGGPIPIGSSGPCFSGLQVCVFLESSWHLNCLAPGAIATPDRALRGRLSDAHSMVAFVLDGSEWCT
jgi:hypothetical protein